MKIVLTGGGTGGHLTIVKSLKDELKRRDIEIYYIGSTKGQDRDWFESDIDFKEKIFLDTKGVVNQKSIFKIISIFNILKSAFTVSKFIKKNRVSKIVSVGGFSSAPASIAAIFMKKNLYIHEQNSVMGTLNRLLKPFSKRFFSSYIEDSFYTNYPINEDFFKKSRVRESLKTIIFIGGSQGAVSINNFALQIASTLNSKSIKIVHQTGKNDFERVKSEYNRLNIDADVFDFSLSLVDRISKADFAVSRAGASTFWELCANQVPTLFIPYPYAAKDHQYFNAKFLFDKNLALLQRESSLNENIVDDILNMDIAKVSRSLDSIIAPNGVKDIVDEILK